MKNFLKTPIQSAIATSVIASGWMLLSAAPAWSDYFCPPNQYPGTDGQCYNSLGNVNPCPGQSGLQESVTGGATQQMAGCYQRSGTTASNSQFNSQGSGFQGVGMSNSNNNDRCKTSNGIDAKFSCDDTENLAQYSQISNIAGQAVGSMTTQYSGIENTAAAQTAGTQAATYTAAANTAKVSAYADAGVGAMNIAMGAFQIKDAMDHSDNADELKKTASAAQAAATNGTFTDINKGAPGAGGTPSLTVTDINGKVMPATVAYKESSDANLRSIVEKGVSANGNQNGQGYYEAQPSAAIAGRQAAATADGAASEQKKDASQGKMAAAVTLLTGAKSVMMAGIDYMQAKEYEEAAAALNAANGATGAIFSPTAGELNPSANNYSAGSTALNPGTAATAGTGAQASTAPAGNSNLGNGVNTGDNTGNTGGGATPSAFTPGLPTAAAGAGGGANLGSSGTGTTPPEVDNSQPKAADNGRQAFGYSGGGAAYVAGGAGGDKGGENLSGLLSQLLPTKKEEETNKNGIMDFANNGRSPASEPYSLLGRNVNLFKRIEDSMQSNWRRGTVGI
jgi:hypothetical protein